LREEIQEEAALSSELFQKGKIINLEYGQKSKHVFFHRHSSLGLILAPAEVNSRLLFTSSRAQSVLQFGTLKHSLLIAPTEQYSGTSSITLYFPWTEILWLCKAS